MGKIIVAHELTYAELAHYHLLVWIDESLAVNTEKSLTYSPSLKYTDKQLQAKHLAFWDAETIQAFWSGAAFSQSGNGSMLAYELARILIKFLAGNWPQFVKFVESASYADAGEKAAQ